MATEGDVTDFEPQPFPHFATDAIHAGQEPDQWNCMAVAPLIATSTTYKQLSLGHNTGFDYTRIQNPTRTCLEKCVASLEGAKYALCFASGMASVLTTVQLLKAGDHVLAMEGLYGGTSHFFSTYVIEQGIGVSYVDCRQLENVEQALKPNTKMVWVESPTNPTMRLVDIAAVCKVVHAKSQAFVVVDNTFMSPYFQRPLSLGADIVMHSMTKYMNGHGDVLMGALVMNDDTLKDRLFALQGAVGTVPSPIDCYMANRGLKTLALRMRQHMTNGLAVARYLQDHPAVEKVLHPGLLSHPQHDLAKRQMRGFSGMLSFYIKGGKPQAAAFMNAVKVITQATSLGDVASLCQLPVVQSHADLPPEERERVGITDNLIRLSVGLEDTQDLLEDLEQALKASQS